MKQLLALSLALLLPAGAAVAETGAASPGQPPADASTNCGGGAISDWRHVQPTPERDACLQQLSRNRPAIPPNSPNSDVDLGARGVPQALVPETRGVPPPAGGTGANPPQ